MFRALCTAALFALATMMANTPSAHAQFVQQGTKLVGTGATGTSVLQGFSSAISADGNTAIVGGYGDNSAKGAVWIYSRSGGVWSQQGNKLVGTGVVGTSAQGYSVAISADGNTAVVGGYNDNSAIGAVWVFVRSAGVWTQQGNKLVPTGSTGAPYMGYGVAISGDGNTIAAGAPNDNSSLGAIFIFARSGTTWSQSGTKLVGTGSTGASVYQGIHVAFSADGTTILSGGSGDTASAGAVWVFVKSNGAYSQQGAKLVGTGAVGIAQQGYSVSVSGDGNTAAFGGVSDDSSKGATWIFVRNGGVWSQQGAKLVGMGAVGAAYQGASVSLSSDGNNLIESGYFDNSNTGAVWAFARTGTTWAQRGTKFVGTGNTTNPYEGASVALSGDGGTVIVGGRNDNSGIGAAWIFTQAALTAAPVSAIAASGNVGGPFSPPSSDYTLRAVNGTIAYTVSGVPAWLTASSTSGSITAGSSSVLTFTVNGSANSMAAGTFGPTVISVVNTTNSVDVANIPATLTVGAPGPVTIVSAVLPASRSVQVGTAATAFSTVINTSSSVATNCGLGLGSSNPTSFRYQTTDSASNALSGTPNTPINIPPNGVQSFVFAMTPSAAFDPTDVPVTAGCSNSSAAPSVIGLNTLLLSASNTPVPDVVALGATASNDGIVNIPGANGTGAFAVATVNVGIGSGIVVSADTGTASVPVSINLCQTNPTTGQCISVVGPTVMTAIVANGTPTFAIFVQGNGTVPFDPAKSRVFVRFKDDSGTVRGATSVAVRTQ